jgi:hypothetical protein
MKPSYSDVLIRVALSSNLNLLLPQKALQIFDQTVKFFSGSIFYVDFVPCIGVRITDD